MGRRAPQGSQEPRSDAPAPEVLTPQQAAFCEAYVANGRNGTQAAITAGYGRSSAHVRASKLLGMPKIQQRLAELVIPAAAKALEELGKKGAELEVRSEQLEQREAAVAELESIEAMRERIKRSMIEALAGMAFTTMADLASWTEEGVQFTPSSELTPEAIQAIETIESQVNEGESQDGKTLFRNVRLKVKRHDRIRAMQELREILEIAPKQPAGGSSAPGVGVLVVVAGGPTGLELGAQVAIVAPPGAGGPAIRGTGEIAAASVPRETTPSSTTAEATPLRPWNPRPRKKATAPSAARAIVSHPTGS